MTEVTTHNMHEAQLHMHHEQILHRIHELWNDLTDDELALYDIAREQFYEAIQKKYGTSKEDIARQLHMLEEQCLHSDALRKSLAA